MADRNKVDTRDTFKKGFDFLFSAGGALVGLGNLWRFPYLCYENGGGAFLISYFTFVVIIALPMVFLETSIGQISRIGQFKAWNMFPLMRGIGLASGVILLYCNIYYPVIMAWALRYLVASFHSELEWTHCNNEYNSPDCFSILNVTNVTLNGNATSSVTEFWEKNVLHKSSGIDETGNVQWPLYLCLVVVWILCYFCIWKGIRWTAKVVYFTATAPIIMIIIMIVRGATLDGAANGIKYYLRPEMSKLANIKVWMAAASQVIYSYGICFGAIVCLGSYNKIKHNCLRDSLLLLVVNSGASFLSGFAVFSVLGFMAKAQNTTVEAVAESGPGLVFLVYPHALSLLPIPQFWCVLFFLTLILLGFDGQFVYLESWTTGVLDFFPLIKSFRFGKELFIASASFIMCVIGITMTTEGGIYVFNLIDTFAAAGWSTTTLCVFEALAGGWIGRDAYLACLGKILNRGPRALLYFKYFWRYVTPASLTMMVFCTLYFYQPATYNKVYVYPPWAQCLGISITCSSIIWVPTIAIYDLVAATGTLQSRLKRACQLPGYVSENLNAKLTSENEISKPGVNVASNELKELI
ncbi:sodium- and chloride-dependent taurine transporter-like [Ciona intestinalis]